MIPFVDYFEDQLSVVKSRRTHFKAKELRLRWLARKIRILLKPRYDYIPFKKALRALFQFRSLNAEDRLRS